MRYLMVSTYPPMKCGIGKYAYQMAKMLRDQGNVVNVVSPKEGDGDFVCELKGGFNLLKLLKFSIFFNKIVVQYHESFYHEYPTERTPSSAISTYLSFFIIFIFLNKKIEVIVHELPHMDKTNLNYALEYIKWHLCPKIIFHTRQEIEDFESHYFKLATDKYELRFPHLYYYKFRDISSSEARRELGLTSEKKIFLCIGFIQPHKGFDRAIRAFRKATNEDIELYIVGSLRVIQDDYVAHLQELRKMAADAPNVHVIERFLSDEEFDTWVSASDIVVIPYREIWSSAVLGRAKLFGKIVIASDAGGLKDQLTETDILFKNDKELEDIFFSFADIIK